MTRTTISRMRKWILGATLILAAAGLAYAALPENAIAIKYRYIVFTEFARADEKPDVSRIVENAGYDWFESPNLDQPIVPKKSIREFFGQGPEVKSYVRASKEELWLGFRVRASIYFFFDQDDRLVSTAVDVFP